MWGKETLGPFTFHKGLGKRNAKEGKSQGHNRVTVCCLGGRQMLHMMEIKNRFLKKVQVYTLEIPLPHTMGGRVGNKWATQSILD